MCCFSAPVLHVGDTSIFARLSGRGTQYLIYQMTLKASQPVAMILPLPVALPARENSVRFRNLKGYHDLFADMEYGFWQRPANFGCAGPEAASTDAAGPLPVQVVGDFVASFVPTLDDFRRLDRRFVIPRATWDKIPEYRDYGFAVFQLRVPLKQEATPHPMAFEFDTRHKDKVFFPTVHIHDGQVHPTEHFEHSLYMQDTGPYGDTTAEVAGKFIKIDQALGMIRGDAPCYRVKMIGDYPNRDVLYNVYTDLWRYIVPGGIAAAAALTLGYRLKSRRKGSEAR